MKFCNHPSVSAIRNAFNPQSFNFSKVSVDDMPKEINKLGNRKAIQRTDLPINALKQMLIFSEAIFITFLFYLL